MSSFEFIIDGPPVSQFARQREGLHAWKDLVREEAERLWPPGGLPSSSSLHITITYYYEDSPVDTNGIIKPITDALIGLVFNDNSQIEGLTQSRQDLHASFRIPNFTPVLAEGFGRGGEFLHVKIDGLPPWGELIQETEPLVSQESNLEPEQPQPDLVQPETGPIPDVETQGEEFSPEGANIPKDFPSFQDVEMATEESGPAEPEALAQEIQLEGAQTTPVENIEEPQTPDTETPAPDNEEVDSQTEIDAGREGEGSSDLFDQAPALQDVDERETPEDSQVDLDHPTETGEDAATIEDQES
jgi:crossover junction endodeoxyribonuclease RusA